MGGYQSFKGFDDPEGEDRVLPGVTYNVAGVVRSLVQGNVGETYDFAAASFVEEPAKGFYRVLVYGRWNYM